MFRLIQTSDTRGDCTASYDVQLDKEYTVKRISGDGPDAEGRRMGRVLPDGPLQEALLAEPELRIPQWKEDWNDLGEYSDPLW